MSELLKTWLNRLAESGPVDLHEQHLRGDDSWRDLLRVFTPRDFTLLPLEGSHVSPTPDGLIVGLTGRLVPPGHETDGPGTGVIERTLRTDEGWARHDKLDIPSDWQGLGLGRTITRESILLYEALGLREVSLYAVQHGRYVWAMCGFEFREASERDWVLAQVGEFAGELGAVIDDLDTVVYPWEIGHIEGDPVPLSQIAEARAEDFEESAPQADTDSEVMLLGKALLLFSDYDGYEAVMPLGDEANPGGRDQLLDYTDPDPYGHQDPQEELS